MNKKELSIILIIVVVLGLILTIGVLVNKIERYEEKLSKLDKEYVSLVTENDKLKDNIEELNSNIYNLFEKKPYELSITHDDTRIIYKQDKFGWFDSYMKSTMY